MDKNSMETFAKFQSELDKRGLYICQKIEANQHVLDKRLGENDICYSVYRSKMVWNKELSEFMTFLNNYRKMADTMFAELCFLNDICLMKNDC